MKPRIDEAVPASWPSGSMASALKFAPIQPNGSIALAKKVTNSQSGIVHFDSDNDEPGEADDEEPSSAPCDRRRMPMRPTRRELR